jgi:uncharacterized membrane protein
VLQVRARAGAFVVKGICLFKVFGCAAEELENAVDELNAHIIVGPIRTPTRDPEHAITQLNQLAARALSPGINDPGTAITCVDWFSLGLAKIVDRDIPGCVFLDRDQRPRLLARLSSFSGIMNAIYTPLRQFSNSENAFTISLLEPLCRLAELTRRADRLSILTLHGEEIWDQIRRQPLSDYELRDIHRRYAKLRSLVRIEC